MLSITLETPDQVDVHRLLRLADERSAALYPAESRHGLDVAALLARQVRFFVARIGGRAIGCGGFSPDDAGTAELRRMFVEAESRGRGVGWRILQAIEDAALREGIRLMQLETGVRSVEAQHLYRRAGYRERGPFGPYVPDPLSVFMEKALADVAP